MSTILELCSLKPVKPFTWSKVVPLACTDPQLIYGMELEIEGIPSSPDEYYVRGITGTADGSLRNTRRGCAWEYITAPMTYSCMIPTLEAFFNKLKPVPECYSERTSIHVHCNVQDFTLDQLQALCMLYQVFEPLLYTFVGSERANNIFCVPWGQTLISSTVLNQLKRGNVPSLKTWQKYTGLNLQPITTQGTVEFRHMPGNSDMALISKWLQLIGCLFAFVRKYDVGYITKHITIVNTSSDYKGLLYSVFGNHVDALQTDGWELSLEEGVTDVKLMLLHEQKEVTVNPPSMDDILTALGRTGPIPSLPRAGDFPNPWDRVIFTEEPIPLHPEVVQQRLRNIENRG